MNKKKMEEEKKRNGRRLIMFPLPLQGCVNPMLQLSKILYSKGFSITIIHTLFNSPSSSNHPNFTFVPISDGLSKTLASSLDVMSLISFLNLNCESPFRDFLAELLMPDDGDEEEVDTKERIACLIDDCSWHFTQDVAEEFKLPRIVLQTYIGSFFLAHATFPLLLEKGYLPAPDADAESLVPELAPLKMKDLPRSFGECPTLMIPILNTIVKASKASSGVIFDSCEELEQDSLTRFREEFRIPIFCIGPFPSYFPSSSSSLLTQDESCVSWLDAQEPNSVVYVSFGSVITISQTEFLEIAWGLSNSNQPFLWAVRPGSVRGSDWIEPLPDGFIGNLKGRGKMVKWAPQQDVLAHRATGGFWTHCGWNSILESIREAVPMICQPGHWDQMMNARYVSDVWRVGFHLEDKIERGEITNAVKRLMVDEEGGEVRRAIQRLKERVEKRLEPGESSYLSLENFVDHILSF